MTNVIELSRRKSCGRRVLAWVAPLLLWAAPAAAQDDLKDLMALFERFAGKQEFKKVETERFVVETGELIARELLPRLEKQYDLCAEILGVRPKEKIPVRISLFEEQVHESAPKGAGEFLDVESGTLYLTVSFDWKRDIARGVSDAFVHHLAPERYDRIPPVLRWGLKAYLGNWDGKMDRESFRDPALGHIHHATWAQEQKSKLAGGKKLAELTLEEFPKREPAAWAVAAFLLGGKGKDPFATWLGNHARGDGEEGPPALPPALDSDAMRFVSGLNLKVPERMEPDGWVAESTYYTIWVQKGTTREKPRMDDRAILRELKLWMDVMFTKYGQAFQHEDFVPKRPRLYYYKNEASYVKVTRARGTLAHYMPQLKYLAGYEYQDDKVRTFHVLAHEGCHQFFDLAFPGFYDSEEMPSWFSEGLAECFGSCEIRRGEIYIFTMSGSAAENLPLIQRAVREGIATPLADLFTMDHREFMQRAHVHYPQAWSVCHFLWIKYREPLIRLIEGFKQGKPRDEVYKDAFGKMNLDALHREWQAWVKVAR